MAKSRLPDLRLFFGLDLPAGARREIASWRDPLVGDLRPVAAASLHVTLVFLGWRREEELTQVVALAEQAAAGKRAARLSPTGVRAVPPRSPRLLALDLEDHRGHCTALQSSMAAALADAGLHRREKRPFWPHLTLARTRRGRPVAPGEPNRLPGPFVADRVVLFRSVPSRHGAVYEPLWTAALDE